MKKRDRYGTEQGDSSKTSRHSVQILGNPTSCEVRTSLEDPRKLTRSHANYRANTEERDKGRDYRYF
jgi:hypothetical protein